MAGSLAGILGSSFFDGAGAGLIGGAFSALGGSSARSASKKQFNAALDFQKQLAYDGIQLRVRDLEKAGLNKILAAGSLGGAQGSSPNPQTFENIGATAITSALAAKRLSAEIKNINEDTEKKKSEKNLNDNLGANAVVQHGILRSQRSSAKSQADVDAVISAIEKTPSSIKSRIRSKILNSWNPLVAPAVGSAAVGAGAGAASVKALKKNPIGFRTNK